MSRVFTMVRMDSVSEVRVMIHRPRVHTPDALECTPLMKLLMP